MTKKALNKTVEVPIKKVKKNVRKSFFNDKNNSILFGFIGIILGALISTLPTYYNSFDTFKKNKIQATILVQSKISKIIQLNSRYIQIIIFSSDYLKGEPAYGKKHAALWQKYYQFPSTDDEEIKSLLQEVKTQLMSDLSYHRNSGEIEIINNLHKNLNIFYTQLSFELSESKISIWKKIPFPNTYIINRSNEEIEKKLLEIKRTIHENN